MIVEMLCKCGFVWNTSTGARTVKVAVVKPEYVPPCPECGERYTKVIITPQVDDLEGTMEITSTGDSVKGSLM